MDGEDEERQLQLKHRWRRHVEVLVVCSAVLVLSFTLQVRTDQKVEFEIAPNWPAPETCLSRAFWDVSCPGCGLTRSFIYLASGDWRASLNVSRIGWVFALAVVLQVPYRVFMLNWLSQRGLPEPVPVVVNRLFGGMLISVLIGNWLLQLVGR